jgi:flagellar hook-associated protein 1 FlgK
MSLTGALQVGRSALAVSQAALQVAGNNMANAATVGFHRQSIHLSPLRGELLGRNAQTGGGVELTAIRREIDVALQARYRNAVSQQQRNLIDQRFLTAIEALQNELSDNDISSQLSAFFNSFSELANNPADNAIRNVVIQQGKSLASRISALRSDYTKTLIEADRALGTAVAQANNLLDQIAQVNAQITHAEGGAGGQANSLRDQRDLLIDELSQYVAITAIEQSNGSVDMLIGSTPVLLGGESRGLALRTTSSGGQTDVSVRVAADGTHLQITSGMIGGLLEQREQTIRPEIDTLDEFAGQLIFQVNRVHSQGQGRAPSMGFTSVAGTYAADDATANLNSTSAGLPFSISNGSFFIHVTNQDTGTRTAHQINVDGNAMSLNDLVNQINAVVAVPNVTASVNVSGQLELTAAAGYEISFSDDTGGALAALGINTFFTGSTAIDIDVNQLIVDNPGILAAGGGHIDGSNTTALAIANLQEQKLEALGGKSLRELWQNSVNGLAVKVSAAHSAVASSKIVAESLNAQIQSVSGVSLDEESINLLTFQRQFQAAARFISVIDETFQTLLSIA